MVIKDLKNRKDSLSYFERMKNADYHYLYNEVVTKPYTAYCTNNVMRNGRIVSERSIKVVNPEDNVRGFKVTDFCIENLQASGAIANLKSCSLNGSQLVNADNITVVLDSLE